MKNLSGINWLNIWIGCKCLLELFFLLKRSEKNKNFIKLCVLWEKSDSKKIMTLVSFKTNFHISNNLSHCTCLKEITIFRCRYFMLAEEIAVKRIYVRFSRFSAEVQLNLIWVLCYTWLCYLYFFNNF